MIHQVLDRSQCGQCGLSLQLAAEFEPSEYIVEFGIKVMGRMTFTVDQGLTQFTGMFRLHRGGQHNR